MDPLDRMFYEHVLSVDAIRQKLDDYTLFCFYMDTEPTINVPVRSPLRADVKPSFALYYNKNQHLRWTDHGTGETGDVFEFIRRKFNIGFREALNLINQDFGLGFDGEPVRKVHVPRKVPVVRPKRKLEITSKKFTRSALDWWRSFHIEQDILQFYNVTQVDWMHWDGYPVKANEMTFAYRIWKYYKIYRPFSSDNKFMNTYPRNYVEGLLQLPCKDHLLIITKALKDVMVLRKLGYEAIAPKSESTTITPDIRDYINQRFNRIVVMFDNDEGGRLGAENYPEYQKIFMQEDEKDISDFARKHGVEKSRSLMYKLLKS